MAYLAVAVHPQAPVHPDPAPLMRRSDGRWPLLVASLAFTVSFVVCGLWHGVSGPWLAWGIFQSVGLIVCNLYRAELSGTGRKGVNRYLANRWIRVVAILVTFEFAATAVAIATYPYQEMLGGPAIVMNTVGEKQRIPAVVRDQAWIAVRLVLVYYLGQQGTLFFYQVI